jgi:ATP dependent DNA ligase domain
MSLRPRALPAGFIAPCLPTSAPLPPSGESWLHEIKHDGFRVIARKAGERVRLYSRPGNDLTYRFPLIVEAVAKPRSQSCIIDGEAHVGTMGSRRSIVSDTAVMLAPDAGTLRTCVTDGRPDGSLLYPIVFGGSGNDCFHLLAPVTSHRHVFCNPAVEHLLVLAVQQVVVGGIEGQPFPIYDHVEPVFSWVSLAARIHTNDEQRRL